MSYVLRNGDKFALTVIPPVTLGIKDYTLKASTDIFFVGGQAPIRASDIPSITVPGVSYTNATYTGGIGIITFEWKHQSDIFIVDNDSVCIWDGFKTGTWSLQVVTPALNPDLTPDPSASAGYKGIITVSADTNPFRF